MSEAVDIWEHPEAEEIYMIAGWRQWADAGSISSGLPKYLVKRLEARQIGTIRPDGFYLFQFPGTHDMVRPVVRFEQGRPLSLETPRNELYYTGDDQRGLIILIGDEPHLNVEQYVSAILSIAKIYGVKRIIGLGGVYGELPYDKERFVSAIYSQPEMQKEIEQLAVNLSDYQGGASIGSYICQRASEQGLEFISFYAFVPTYDFSNFANVGNSVRIENDYMAWNGIMRRINFMLKLEFDFSDLDRKSRRLIRVVESRLDELDRASPQLGLREYIANLSDNFTETTFEPLDDVWEEEFRRLFDDDPADA